MKTTDAVTKLNEQLSECRRLKAARQRTQELIQTKSSRLDELLLTTDLDDDVRLDEISRLQVAVQLAPRKLELLEQAEAEAEARLVDFTNACVTADVGPLGRKLLARAREQARIDLAPHFPDEIALSRAVDSSAGVHRVEGLTVAVDLHPFKGGESHALRVLSALDELRALDSQPRQADK